mgnify:CR=1 FL=1
MCVWIFLLLSNNLFSHCVGNRIQERWTHIKNLWTVNALMKFIYVVDIYISRIRNKMIKFLNILIKKTPPFIPVTSHSRHNTIQFTSSAAILILSLSLSFLSLKYKVQKKSQQCVWRWIKKILIRKIYFILFYKRNFGNIFNSISTVCCPFDIQYDFYAR